MPRNALPIKYEDIELIHVTTPIKVYKKIGVQSPVAIETIPKNGSPIVYVPTPSKIPSDNFFNAPTSSTPVLTPKTRSCIEEFHEPARLKPI